LAIGWDRAALRQPYYWLGAKAQPLTGFKVGTLRLPSAVLAAALVLLAFLSLGLGLIINSTNLRLLELEKLICKRPAQRRDPESGH
jgi:hypothetical protein